VCFMGNLAVIVWNLTGSHSGWGFSVYSRCWTIRRSFLSYLHTGQLYSSFHGSVQCRIRERDSEEKGMACFCAFIVLGMIRLIFSRPPSLAGGSENFILHQYFTDSVP
jgi:hypothetical protein